MDCLFCKIANKEIESKILYEDNEYLAFLDMNQDTPGHTLVIPKRHVTDVTGLTDIEFKRMFEIANKLSEEFQNKLNSKGFTYLFNYLEAQEIKHTHLHILPDYFIKKEAMNIDEVYNILKSE